MSMYTHRENLNAFFMHLKRMAKRALHTDWLMGFIIGFLVVLPIIFMLARTSGVLAPYNILSGCCGWRWAQSSTPLNLIPSDVNDFVMPDRAYVKEAFLEGQIPVWNPLYFGGEVFLANLQSTVFHPVNLLLFVASIHTVQNVSTLMSLSLMAAGMYILVRKLNLSRKASAFAAVTYALMPFAIFWSTFGMMTWSMAFFPFVMALLLQWHRTKKVWYLSALSIVLGLSIFMGHIQFSIVNFVLIGFLELAILLFGAGSGREKTKNTLIVSGFILAGVIIGAVQLLPFLEQVPIGHRQGTILTTGPDSLMKMADDLKSFFKIYEFKTNVTTIEYFLEYAPFVFTIGFIPAIFSLLGIARGIHRRDKTILMLTALFIFGMFWMWGSWPHQILSTLSSVFKGLRPTYFISIPLFVAVLLSAYGFDYTQELLSKWLSKARLRLKREKVIRTGLIILLVLSIVAILIYVLLTTVPSLRHHVGNLDMMIYNLLPLSVVITSYALFSAKQARFSMLAFIAVVFFQGIALFISTQPMPAKSLYTIGNPYYEAVVKDSNQSNSRNIRIVYPFSPQTSMFYGLGALNGYDALYAASTEKLVDAINYPVKTVKYSEGSRNAIYINNTQKENVLKSLGIEYIITDEKRVPPKGYNMIYSGLKSDTYVSNSPAGQVYFAHVTTKGSSKEQLLALRNATLQYREVMGNKLSSIGSYDPNSKVSYDIGINSIKIKTSSKTDNTIFVAQTFRPQWYATLDGRSKLTINQANYNFMAVSVPKGTHEVELQYQPKSYTIGLYLTGLTLISVVLAVPVAKRMRRMR